MIDPVSTAMPDEGESRVTTPPMAFGTNESHGAMRVSLDSLRRALVSLLAVFLALITWVLPLGGQTDVVKADTLTLDEVIRITLMRSPDIRRAQAQELQAAGGEWDGFGRLLPSVSMSMGLNESQALQRTANDPITGGIVELPDSLVDRRRTFGTSLSLGAAWTLLEGGQPINQLGAARRRSRAADAALRAARVRVTAEVIVAYLNAVETEALAEVRRREAARDAEMARTARARYEIGAIPEVELLQAELAANNAELDVLDAEGTARFSRMALLELAGLPPDPTVALRAPPEPAAIGDDASIRAMVYARSEILEENEARLSAARWEARSQHLRILPSVGLNLNWSWSEFGGTSDAFTLDPRNSQTSIRLSFSWAGLQSPGGVMGDRLRARATELAANAEYEATIARFERDLVAGLDRLERARTLRDRVQISLSSAERQLEQAEERYRLGLTPLLERLTAESLWAEAARQEVAARHAPLRAIAELERTTGVAFWLAELR